MGCSSKIQAAGTFLCLLFAFTGSIMGRRSSSVMPGISILSSGSCASSAAGSSKPLFGQPHHDLLKRVMLLAHLIAEEVCHALAEQIIIIYRPA